MTKWIAAIAILLMVIGPIAVLPGHVGAQGTITVIDQGVENQFPDGLRFFIFLFAFNLFSADLLSLGFILPCVVSSISTMS